MSLKKTHTPSLADVSLNQTSSRSRGRVQLSFKNDPGKTEQSHKSACDLSLIIKRHLRSGMSFAQPPEVFADFTNLPDYQTSLNAVNSINELFASLPSAIRSHYNQNPGALIDDLNDPSTYPKLVELGLLKAPVEPKEPVTVPDPVSEPKA